jgi:protein ImuB
MSAPVVATAKSRTLVVWCPDWPAVAAARLARIPSSDPVAVFYANRVQACTAAARAEGIRMGMRRRDAQSRCPELSVQPVDHDRDARLFEPVAAAVEEIAPGIEVLRPGMIACAARGPVRYFGSEERAAEHIVDAVEALDVECVIGIADVLPVAVLAARQSVMVPPGGDAAFCAALPITELAREPAIAPAERADLVDLLIRLGITTAGAFAALPAERVATRFGADAIEMHRLAAGLGQRGVSRRDLPAELGIEEICDPPLDRVDAAAFLARALAERFHAQLTDAGLACTRLAISARTDRGKHLTRTWRCARPLTAAATADRLRWQLDGWLTAGRRLRPAGSDSSVRPEMMGPEMMGPEMMGPGAITFLRLEPVEAIGSGLVQYGLWGSDGEDDTRASWAFARVQGLLGPEAVLSPVISGGRGPADRITLVSWGDERVPERDPDAPWPGALPAPTPSRLTDPDASPVLLVDSHGAPVTVTDRGLLSAAPTMAIHTPIGDQPVLAWAGPWILDERWWAPPEPRSVPDRAKQVRSWRPAGGVAARPAAVGRVHQLSGAPAATSEKSSRVFTPPRRRARMQVVLGEGPALLVCFGSAGWQVEGVYD